jgi:maltose-binding protein MalE
MKICLVSHTENFKANKRKYSWLIQEFEKLEKKLGKEIPITWTLEEDDTKPFSFEIRAGNEGDVISKGSKFFKKLRKRGHELGVHVHFVKKDRVDFSYSNQKRLIKNAKDKFVSAFGFKPKSFVGGWWHSDENTEKILEE